MMQILAAAMLLALPALSSDQHSRQPLIVLKIGEGAAARTSTYPRLPAALAAAEAVRRDNPQARLRFQLAAGTYRLTAPLVLPASISGTPQAPTVFASARGARATISGSHLLALHWQPYHDGIFVADLDEPAFDQLWMDGKRQVRARYPNYDPNSQPFNGTAADAISPQRVARWKDPAGGELRAMHQYRWGSAFWPIEGKNTDGTLKLGQPTANNRAIAPDPTQPHAELRYVENIFEELDAPHEWFYDAKARKLYYKPPEGVHPSRGRFECAALDNLVVVAATRTAPVHDIRLEGLTFTHSARTVMHQRERILRSDWALDRSGAVLLEGAERVSVVNSDFRDLGGNAVFVSGYNLDVTIQGSLFQDIGGSGIHFAGRLDSVRSPVIGYPNGQPLEEIDRTPGPKSEDYPRQSIARDNLITDVGVTDKQAAGIAIDIASEIVVSHNSIYDVPRAGINIGTGNFGGHIIEFNDVFNTVLQSNDHGSFNSWGRDRYWHPDLKEMRRRVAANPNLPFLDVVKPIVLRNNRWRCDNGFDVDLDDGSSNYEIYNNLLLKGGLKEREGFRRIATNNIIINNSLHPHVSFKDSGDVFKHNIVMGPYQPILVDQWDSDFDHNLFTSRVSLEEARKLGSDAHSILGEPMFIDAPRGDFRVRPGSPAYKIGLKNFPMNFGVESPRLRRLAKTPEIPALLTAGPVVPGKTYDFSGATIKSIETLGEQSALGTDKVGALVVAVPEGSKAARGGLKKGDVVKSVDVAGSNFPVNDAPLLLVLQASHKWQQKLHINVFRDHKMIKLEIPYE
jgi:hypothetical protein